MIIESKAPTRIDLAGGTIDLWPLYLFHENSQTINFAIDQYAKCRIETREDGRFVVESKDRNVRIEADSLEQLRGDDELSLISKLIYFFKPQTGLSISTDCMAPAGAGLGGSSALDIAVCGALNKLTGERYKPEQLPFIAINVETQVLKVPAGYQDYFPAVHGRVSRIKLQVEGVTREEVVTDLDELERRVALCFTGAPRNSGINNWEMYKRHIDNAPGIFDRFERIRDTALKIDEALTARTFDKIGAIFAEEWASRRELAPGITTPFIDQLIEIAGASGAEAAKVCGAGGGGCVAFYCQPKRKAEVEDALSNAGGQIIPYRIAREGLSVIQK
ncbi:MAG: D-glycero-alpha-D-manno-heptose 7-phosphate kinase [Acidobacteria bacterium]|nr:D-glycero-alpha-D-manno-heptose 7-phosphate kinase [Acidobacteriota bacterium]